MAAGKQGTKTSSPRVAVIMAGGSGTRFWPLSKKNKPKQYFNLLGDRTLIQQTFDRIGSWVSGEHTFVVSTLSQRSLLEQQLPEAKGWILEPAARNTAPCLMLSLSQLLKRGYSADTVMVVLPADHFIADVDAFHRALDTATETARREHALVTLGIKPSHAHTGYGYIEAGEETSSGVHRVSKFVEKPTFDRAAQYLRAGNYYWNGGIFVWTLGALQKAFETFCSDSWNTVHKAQGDAAVEAAYQSLEAVPIDIAVMEKAPEVRVIPVEMGWSDIGSWDALYRELPMDAHQNAVSGNAIALESHGCLIRTPADKKVAVIGAKNLIVVDTGDCLLICDRSQDQLVRNAAKKFDE